MGRYRTFGIYSGRFDGNRNVYEDTGGFTSTPISTDDPLFLDLCVYGVEPSSVVSVYVRQYEDGTVVYLAPTNRWRRVPQRALSAWQQWTAEHLTAVSS